MAWTIWGAMLLAMVVLAKAFFVSPGDKGASGWRSEEEAMLRVAVRSRDTGEPVAGVHVEVRLAEASAWSAERVASSEGRLGQSPTTDADGRARFRVPSGRALVVVVSPGPTGGGQVAVEPLPDSAERDIVVQVATRHDVLLTGRVVADETGEPVTDARIATVDRPRDRHFGADGKERVEEHESTLEVDASGRFELLIASWTGLRLEVRAPGRGTRLITVDRGREPHADPLEVRLSKAAELEICVVGPAGEPIRGARVEAAVGLSGLHQGSTPLFDVVIGSLTLIGRTSPGGSCTLKDVPSGQSCRVEVSLPGQKERASSRILALEPGERRVLVVQVGLEATLTGMVVDASGAPASSVELWLLRRQYPFVMLFEPQERARSRVTRSDSAGRFSFEGLTRGGWLLGPAPGGLHVPMPQEVLVEEGSTRLDVRLEVARGLDVEGVVLGPDGGPVAGARLDAYGTGGLASARADEQGRFELGPVSPGSLSLTAFGGPGLARGKKVEVEAGARGVVLRLAMGGDVRGVLREGETGLPVRGWVAIIPSERSGTGGELESTRTATVGADGCFSFEGLGVGTYDLSGATIDHKVAVSAGLTISGEAEPLEADLYTEPGAVVLLVNSSMKRSATFRLWAAGVRIGVPSVSPNEIERAVVPGGDVRVEVLGPENSTLVVHEFRMLVGEARSLEVGSGE